MSLLEVKNLVVEFPGRRGTLRALDDISFSIAPGEILGVVGESGAGKSLTGAAIIDLLELQREGATDAPTKEAAPDTPSQPDAAPKARTPREGTKQATLIAMLRAPDGATIEEIMAATGWQSHYADPRIMPM